MDSAPLLPDIRRQSPFYGKSPEKRRLEKERARASAAAGLADGSIAAPAYAFGGYQNGSIPARARPGDFVAVLRDDGRVAGFARVKKIADVEKRLLYIEISKQDESGALHGGFIFSDRNFYRPGVEIKRVHVTHLKFLRRRGDPVNSPGALATGSGSAVSSSSNQHRERKHQDRRRIIHELLDEELAKKNAVGKAGTKGQDATLYSARCAQLIRRLRRSSVAHPRSPKISSPDVKQKSNLHWLMRAKDLRRDADLVWAVERRRNEGYHGRPEKCSCGLYAHECIDANCIFERAKITGEVKRARRRQQAQWRLDKQRRRVERGATNQELPFEVFDDVEELDLRIRAHAVDRGRQTQMPNVNRQAFVQENEAFKRLHQSGERGDLKDDDAEEGWVCAVCTSTNRGVVGACLNCGRERGRELDMEDASKRMRERLERLMDNKRRGVAEETPEERKQRLRLERRQERLQRLEARRDERRLERQGTASTDGSVERQLKSTSDANELGNSIFSISGMREQITRSYRSSSNIWARGHLDQKTLTGNAVAFFAGTNYTDAVEDATFQQLRNGDRLFNDPFSGDSDSSSSGSDSDSSSDSDSDSDSDE